MGAFIGTGRAPVLGVRLIFEVQTYKHESLGGEGFSQGMCNLRFVEQSYGLGAIRSKHLGFRSFDRGFLGPKMLSLGQI